MTATNAGLARSDGLRGALQREDGQFAVAVEVLDTELGAKGTDFARVLRPEVVADVNYFPA